MSEAEGYYDILDSMDPAHLDMAARSTNTAWLLAVAKNPNSYLHTILDIISKVPYGTLAIAPRRPGVEWKDTDGVVAEYVAYCALLHPKITLDILIGLAKINQEAENVSVIARDVLRSKDILSELLDE